MILRNKTLLKLCGFRLDPACLNPWIQMPVKLLLRCACIHMTKGLRRG